MENKLVKCRKLNISNSRPFTLIAGPCQLENEKHALDIAAELKQITKKLNKIVESWIRQYPSQWFWVHDRWKR